MIAMAIANQPRLLIADEPTTALDVTIQAQILDVLRTAKEEVDSATVLITHDLGVVAEMADRVAVMYAGRIAESGGIGSVFGTPRHPYTLGLLATLPRLDGPITPLEPIPGHPPDPIRLPEGCPFHPRCDLRQGRPECVAASPALLPVGGGHRSACHFADELASAEPVSLGRRPR